MKVLVAGATGAVGGALVPALVQAGEWLLSLVGLAAPDSHDHLRRAERPPYEQLVAEVRDEGFSAVGRRYGVSDNAIRKWIRRYERELSCDPPV